MLAFFEVLGMSSIFENLTVKNLLLIVAGLQTLIFVALAVTEIRATDAAQWSKTAAFGDVAVKSQLSDLNASIEAVAEHFDNNGAVKCQSSTGITP